MNRVIGHVDLDYFYAQVEEVENPSIKSRPVVVCVFSGRTEDSGVVSTANYRAREFGVRSGMPIVLAKKKLEGKDPVLVKMDRPKYEAISKRIMGIVEDHVDVLEQTGIDEAFFDITSSTGGDYTVAMRAAGDVKESILRGERLTCSIGVGRSKVVAKLASDMAKPGGLAVVLPESTQAFLDPLDVNKLYGVGPKTAAILEEMKVRTIGELSRADPVALERSFGRKLGAFLLAASGGTDDDPVLAGIEPSQYSRIVTLKRDTRDSGEAFAQLSEEVAYIRGKLMAEKKSFRTIAAIGILTDLTTHTKSKTFETPVSDVDTINEYAQVLLRDLAGSVQKDFRRIGLRVSGLIGDEDQKTLSEFLHPAR